MKAMNIVIGLVLGLMVGLGGGYALWGTDGGSLTAMGPGGGTLDQTTREQMASMTDEERQAFFAEQGIQPRGGGGSMGAGARSLEGTVLALDEVSMMIELEDGGSQTIYLSDGTTYAQTSDAGSELLSEGVSVRVAGTPQADGVFTADSVVVSTGTAE